jgi:mono/diheme cytochrome c family protein
VFERTINGGVVSQTWRYPSRAECLICHTPQARHTLSFTASQLHPPPGATAAGHDLQALIRAGYFQAPPASVTSVKTLARLADPQASLEWRARSWLAVNCASCHRAGGTGGGFFDLQLATATADTGVINGPLSDGGGDPANRVVVPGDLDHSMLWQRMRTRGPGAMPPVGSTVVDPEGVELVRQWIESLAQPVEPETPSVHASLVDGKLELRVRQPANQAVTLEASPTLDPGRWSPVELPGLSPGFWVEPRELTLEPVPEPSTFYRVRGQGP